MMITSTVLTVMLRVGGLFIFNFEGSSIFCKVALNFIYRTTLGFLESRYFPVYKMRWDSQEPWRSHIKGQER